MIAKVSVFVALTACGALVVNFGPELAAGMSRPAAPIIASANAATAETAARGVENHKAACKQGWPYYEQSCLHDSRQSDGAARLVRVIAIDRMVASGGQKARR